jgi:uncharacterized membrane protein
MLESGRLIVSSAPRDRFFYLVVSLFLLVFASESFVNHYLFRTYAWDLGIITNSLYDYSQFRANNCMLLQPQFANLLSDHFTLIPVLVSPLRYLFGTYTLLFFQVFMILIGGAGAYKYIYLRSDSLFLARAALIHFYTIWGVYSALAFDYHDNVVAAMLVPWLFLMLEKRNFRYFFLILVLIIVSKENMALWAGFICIGLFVHCFTDRQKRLVCACGTLLSFLGFLVIVKIIMPALSNGGRDYLHFEYSVLGINPSEVPAAIMDRPLVILKSLFVNLPRYASANGIKAELHYVILLSGGVFLLMRPVFIFMLIPVYAQKLFNNDFTKWGLNQHYSIEFVPILALGSFIAISQMGKSESWKNKAGLILVVSTLLITGIKMENRVSKWYIKENTAFYQPAHWKRDFDVSATYEILGLIPNKAKVSASSVLVPHLALRETIYQYPVVNDAEYIVLLNSGAKYPLSDQQFEVKLLELSTDPAWQLVKKSDVALLFKRK